MQSYPSSESEANGIRSYVWNPSGFDPAEYLGESLRKRSDLARFVAHKIVCANVFKRTNKDGYAQLKAEYLRPFFPDSRVYSAVMRRLIDERAILRDGSYIPGNKSFGYKLNAELSVMPHIRFPVSDRILAGKIASYRDDSLCKCKSEPVHRYLRSHLESVRIDERAALEMIHAEGFDPTCETAVRFIASGKWHSTHDEYGRFHTNVTSLKRELRQFLSVRGEGLVNLDIRNSQPLIFAAILKERFGSRELPADIRHFIELCEKGTLYDHLMDASGIPSDQRSAFKARFYGGVFFCENHWESSQKSAFADIFPGVLRVIHDIKARDHAALAHELQRKESSIMIGGVASRCMREIPRSFVGTIHDSILCHRRDAERIRRYILSSFAEIQLTPTIKIEAD